jgi:UDP-N-acetyl-2-amino-2-deoxyglucuronate dehydrogenase
LPPISAFIFFDLLLWIFGDVKKNNVTLHSPTSAIGELELEGADVNWVLSIEEGALPAEVRAAGRQTFRILTIDEDVFDFSEGFADLHTQSYTNILAGNGFPLAETRKVIELVHDIRNTK